MAQAKTKVFHLEMEGKHYYFGSPKAMFDIMGEEKMGMKYQSFHSNISLKPGDEYTNRRNGYIIRVGLLGQAKTNRSNRWQDIIKEGIASALNAQMASAQPAEAQVAEPAAQEPIEPITTAAEPEVTSVPEPVAEPAVTAPAATEPVTPTPVPKPSRKKKNADIPEQLTLF